MAERKKATDAIPALKNWGGIRSVQQRLGRSATLEHNREAVATELLCMATTKITDILTWDEAGNVRIKAASQIPEQAIWAIKNVKVRTRVDKEGNSTSELDIELHDKVQVLRLLAKASGLLDAEENAERPSVIGINLKAPDVVDIPIEEEERVRRD